MQIKSYTVSEIMTVFNELNDFKNCLDYASKNNTFVYLLSWNEKKYYGKTVLDF